MVWQAPGKWTRHLNGRGFPGRLGCARSLMTHEDGATLALYVSEINDDGLTNVWWWELRTPSGEVHTTRALPWVGNVPFIWADAILRGDGR